MEFLSSLLPNYTPICNIGKGATCDVFIVRHPQFTNPLAAKIVNFSDCANEEEIKNKISRVREEAAIHSQLNHPNIIKMYDVVEGKNAIAIIMEYASKGTLVQNMVYGNPMPLKRVREIFTQICSVINYLHKKGIVHRDLKAENILLDRNNNVKLIDFGFSKKMSGQNELLQTRCGSPCYASPEIILASGYNEKTDIWSIGVILYLLTVGTFPFFDYNIQRLFSKILNTPLEFPSNIDIPQKLKDLISKMLDKNSDSRPSITEILKHEWLAGIPNTISLNSFVKGNQMHEFSRSFTSSKTFKSHQCNCGTDIMSIIKFQGTVKPIASKRSFKISIPHSVTPKII